MEVESFLASVAHTVARDVKDDMAMAMKGIVAVRKPPKSKPKPTVQIDDDNGDLCDELEYRLDSEEGHDVNDEVDQNATIELGTEYGIDNENNRKENGAATMLWMKMEMMLASIG